MERGKVRISPVVWIRIGDIREVTVSVCLSVYLSIYLMYIIYVCVCIYIYSYRSRCRYVLYVYALCMLYLCVSYLSPMRGSRSNNILGAMTTLSIQIFVSKTTPH